MKKIALFLALALLSLSLASCTNNNNDNGSGETTGADTSSDTTAAVENGGNEDIAGNVSSTDSLSDIMTYILNGVNIEYMTDAYEITQEQFEMQFFIPYIDGCEAYTSAALIGSIAHCVNLLRVPEGSDADAVAKEIEANADPRKWICVEAEATAVKRCGNLILLVMSTTDIVNGVVANFDTIAE